MTLRSNTIEGEEAREKQASALEGILQEDSYADQTIMDRLEGVKFQMNHPDEVQRRENDITHAKGLEQQGIQYNGRMSPIAKEELYHNYQKGVTIKDLSLKYGILPQRVKAIIFQRHIYWNEVYPKLGETHMRLALEREMLYASEFPFIDYGSDLKLMSEIEKGIMMIKVKRSDIDANPPEQVKKAIEAKLSQLKPKRHDHIPEGFTGKGGKGYVLKNWVVHRGQGAPIVNKRFREAVRLAGSHKEHLLNKKVRMRMEAGGPRYASMAERK